MVIGGKGVWKINWKTGIDIYILPYTKSITNKGLLHSIGNSTQYYTVAYMGKRVNICTYIDITDSLYYTPKTNTML